MITSIIDRLNQKMENLRLERRYTRQRSTRTHYVSEAYYVNGEYFFSTDDAKTNTHIGELHQNQNPAQHGKISSLCKMGLDWKKKGDKFGCGPQLHGSRVKVRDVRRR